MLPLFHEVLVLLNLSAHLHVSSYCCLEKFTIIEGDGQAYQRSDLVLGLGVLETKEGVDSLVQAREVHVHFGRTFHELQVLT